MALKVKNFRSKVDRRLKLNQHDAIASLQ